MTPEARRIYVNQIIAESPTVTKALERLGMTRYTYARLCREWRRWDKRADLEDKRDRMESAVGKERSDAYNDFFEDIRRDAPEMDITMAEFLSGKYPI